MNSIQLSNDVTLYGEAGAYESLMGNMRKAEEAVRSGYQRVVQMRLHDAIEAATMLGTHLSNGRWATAAAVLDRMRDGLVKANPFLYRDAAFRTAAGDGLANIRLSLTMLRHGGTLH